MNPPALNMQCSDFARQVFSCFCCCKDKADARQSRCHTVSERLDSYLRKEPNNVINSIYHIMEGVPLVDTTQLMTFVNTTHCPKLSEL